MHPNPVQSMSSSGANRGHTEARGGQCEDAEGKRTHGDVGGGWTDAVTGRGGPWGHPKPEEARTYPPSEAPGEGGPADGSFRFGPLPCMSPRRSVPVVLNLPGRGASFHQLQTPIRTATHSFGITARVRSLPGTSEEGFGFPIEGVAVAVPRFLPLVLRGPS